MPEPPRYQDRPCKTCGTHALPNAAWLRWRRERAGLTITELGARLGYSLAYLSDIERGQRHCPPYIAHAYAALEPRTGVHT